MPRVIVLSMVALLATFSFAWGQDTSVVVPGARIRITELGSGENGRRAGTVVTVGKDTIALRLDRDEATVPISIARITQVEVSQGRQGHTFKGMGLGSLAGAGAGALVGASSCGTCGGGEDVAADRLLNTLAWAGIGAGVGMLVGGVIGAVHKNEKWETVPVSRWRLTAGPSRRGFALALSRSLEARGR